MAVPSLFVAAVVIQCVVGYALPPTNGSCALPAAWYKRDTLVIPVYKMTDFYLRLNFPITQHVTLEVQNDIGNLNLLLNEWFTNTTILSKCGQGYRLTARSPQHLAITISSASNVYIFALNVSMFDVKNQPACLDPHQNFYTAQSALDGRYFEFNKVPCIPLLVYSSSNLEIVGNDFAGGVHLFDVSNVLVDGNQVNPGPNGTWSLQASNRCQFNQFLYQRMTIRNNLLIGASGVKLSDSWGTGCGIHFTNNQVVNYTVTGITVASGYLHYIANNILIQDANYRDPRTHAILLAPYDAGVNTTVMYNHLKVTLGTCFGIYQTSGHVIDQNICVGADHSYDVSQGWQNSITRLLTVNPVHSNNNWCQAINKYGCVNGPDYDTYPIWKNYAPWIVAKCKGQSVQGIPCAANATYMAASANCSGLNLLNQIDVSNTGPITMVENLTACPNYPALSQLNTLRVRFYNSTNITIDNQGFARLVAGSLLALDQPLLANFPYEALGIQPTNWDQLLGLEKVIHLPTATTTTDLLLATVTMVAGPVKEGSSQTTTTQYDLIPMVIGIALAVILILSAVVVILCLVRRNPRKFPTWLQNLESRLSCSRKAKFNNYSDASTINMERQVSASPY